MEVDIGDVNISELVEAAAAGQEVVLVKDGRPVARLVPFRQLGGLQGRIRIADDFDDPLELTTSGSNPC